MSTQFWSPSFWLPPGVTWEVLEEMKVLNLNHNENENYAEFSDLLYSIPMALGIMVIRLVVEKVILQPLGLYWGVKEVRRPLPAQNRVMEDAFKTSTTVKQNEIKTLSIASGLSEKQIERWFRQKRQSLIPSKLQKFSETGWRFLFYTSMLLYGFYCLIDKPWFWNTQACWDGYPDHKVDNDVWYYYMVELSFYISLSVSQFSDVKRKDFLEMFFHHTITIALIVFSWTTHFTRVGTLVLLIHDCIDPILEFAKMLRYLEFKKICDALFVLFSLVWVITRCGIFPYRILYSTLIDGAQFIEMFPAYYVFNGLLVSLQILHIIWTYMLFKVVHKTLSRGRAEDDRSDSESEPSADENENNDGKKFD